MIEILTAEERIQSFIINNLLDIQRLIKPYRELRDALLDKEDGLYHIDIRNQYGVTIRSIIAVYCAQHLQITALEAIMVIQELDVNQI